MNSKEEGLKAKLQERAVHADLLTASSTSCLQTVVFRFFLVRFLSACSMAFVDLCCSRVSQFHHVPPEVSELGKRGRPRPQRRPPLPRG